MKSILKQRVCITPAVFPVYASLLTLQWLKKTRWLAAVEKLNTKAELLYNEIDRNPLFKGAAAVEDRQT
jgi:phosphoserine aminotransferase